MKYNTEKENKTFNNYNEFFQSIDETFKNKIDISNEKTFIAPIKEDKTILQKTYGLFLTFTKDVVLGSLLFATASIGIGAIIVSNHMVNDKKPYIQATPVYEVMRSSDSFNDYSQALINKTTTEDSVIKLKESNNLNEVGKVLFKNTTMFSTPLAQAVDARRLDTVTQLVNAGADINFLYEDQPLMLYKLHDITLKDNKTNPKKIFEEVQIATYLISKGLDWKADNFYLLKTTANLQIWRNFWINYLTKNEPEFLPTYREILKSELTSKDLVLMDELKWLEKNNFN